MYLENPIVVQEIQENRLNYTKLVSKNNTGNSCNCYGASVTEDEINTVHFNPIETEGKLGKAVIIPPEDIWKRDELFGINNYNLLASDRIPLNRTLPDMRTHFCQLKKYPKILPETSVIIIFHNEAWSVLLRTVWSVINRTPKQFLKEIILVDDASEREFLKDELDQYIKQISSVSIKIIRMGQRKGIVAARLAGANIARGKVLTFLDSHCECSEGWIEPLLARIKETRNIVICPSLDLIGQNDFSYITTNETFYYMITWNLKHSMASHNKNSLISPVKTPLMAGGIFSIDRNYFYEMGTYDSEMKYYGGENIEMSFRIWQCGGQIEIHPCSNVGHLDRVKPYSFPGESENVIKSNLERVALVWMDEWSDFFFLYNTLNMENFHNRRNRINIADRLKLRKRLRCKPFSWYLKNIWPNNFFPAHNRFYGKIVWLDGSSNLVDKYDKLLCKILSKVVPTKWSDIIKKIWQNAHMLMDSINYSQNYCLQTHLNVSRCDRCKFVGIENCLSDNKLKDNFVITDEGIIMTNENNCINFNPEWKNENSLNVVLNKCVYKTSWEYHFKTQKIFISNTDLCLTIEKDAITIHNVEKGLNYTAKNLVILKKCSIEYDLYQKWALIPLPWTSYRKIK